MPVTFNANALDLFSKASFGNENAIVRMGSDNTLKSDSTFSSGNIFRWMRGSAARQQNNEIRTQLLRSLGESFGLSGMKTASNGEITFSKDFMDKLEQLLGPAFKREDFGVPAGGGAVSSGKPLTQRRLQAICASARIYDVSDFNMSEYKQKIGFILKEQFGIKTTLGLTEEEFNKLSENNPAFQVYAGIEKSLDFLQKDFKGFFIEEPNYSLEKSYDATDEDLEKFSVRFQIRDLKTGNYEDMRPVFNTNDPEEMRRHSPNSALFRALRGNLIHTERANFNSATSRDIDPLNKYVEGTLKSFIKNGVDAYMEARMNGKVGDLMERLQSPGACTEEKALRFYEFRQKHFQEKVDTALEANLNRIIENTEFTPFNKVIEAELESIDKTHPEYETWDQYGAELKRRLVGLQRPMVTMTESNGKTEFTTQTDRSGGMVTRKITPEDIDSIGRKIYGMIYGEE